MAEEPVIAPDQLKPGHRRAAQIGAVLTIVALLLLTIGNHEGRIEDLYLVGGAAIIAAALVIDVVLRRYGIKR